MASPQNCELVELNKEKLVAQGKYLLTKKDIDKVWESTSVLRLIPADRAIEEEIENLKEGDMVNLEGMIVDIIDKDSRTGWKSVFNESSNAGNIILFVTKVAREESVPQ